jgi:hypothetical protein
MLPKIFRIHVSEFGGILMRYSRSWLATTFASTLFVATWGCSDGTPAVDTTTAEAKVSGVVKVRGKPMAGGEITFDASNNQRTNVEPRKATIGSDGSYSITTFQGFNTARISGPMIKKEPQLGYSINRFEVQPGENTWNIDLPPE